MFMLVEFIIWASGDITHSGAVYLVVEEHSTRVVVLFIPAIVPHLVFDNILAVYF